MDAELLLVGEGHFPSKPCPPSNFFASGSGNKLCPKRSALFSAQMNSCHSPACLHQRAAMYMGSLNVSSSSILTKASRNCSSVDSLKRSITCSFSECGRWIEPAVAVEGVAAVRPNPNPLERARGEFRNLSACLGERAAIGTCRDECTTGKYPKPLRSPGAGPTNRLREH